MSGRSADLIDGRYCTRCGYSHARTDRLAILRRILGSDCDHSADAIAAAWPCLWGASQADIARQPGSTSNRLLFSDLRALGAVRRVVRWNAGRVWATEASWELPVR